MKKAVFIIAEAGVNHNGSLSLAKKLINAASEAGADAVKFQTFKTELGISKHVQKADYQKKLTDSNESQFDMIKKLELSEADHNELIQHCKIKNIQFMSTPFDHESIDYLNDVGMSVFKIPSGEITNLPYLRHIGSLNKQIILSTGMANLGEIENAVDVLCKAGTARKAITILHATTEYPCPFDEVNLKAMQTIANAFDVKVGYSDHTNGIEIPVAAVAMGAVVIEKHFTLDKTMDGPDHQASLEPDELVAMVKAIRNVETALGNGIKKPSNSELKNIAIARKCIVAKGFIKQGEIFTEMNLAVKRAGVGLSPMRWDEVIGTVAQKNYSQDEPI